MGEGVRDAVEDFLRGRLPVAREFYIEVLGHGTPFAVRRATVALSASNCSMMPESRKACRHSRTAWRTSRACPPVRRPRAAWIAAQLDSAKASAGVTRAETGGRGA